MDFFDSIIYILDNVMSFLESLFSSILTLFSVLTGAVANIPILLSYMPQWIFALSTACVAIYVVKLVIGRDS